MIVEDGTGLPGAESYVSTDTVAAYAEARGLSWPDGTSDDAGEAACRRGTSFIDNTYRKRFTGYKTKRRNQALEWPRIGAYVYTPNNTPYLANVGYYDPSYDYIASNEIPVEVINATCEAAIKELASPGILSPDLDRGNAVKRLKAGSVEIEYGASASSTTTFQTIDLALSGLLRSDAVGIRAVRG